MTKTRLLGACLALASMNLATPSLAQDDTLILPYKARYQVTFRGLKGGDIEFVLERTNEGRYKFSSHLFPSFIGSLFASDQAEDSSEVEIDSRGVRPLHFTSDDGTSKTQKDIRQDFDWAQGKVTGRAENKDFELKLPDGAQDRLTIQLAASVALRSGRELGTLTLVEGDELKEYRISRQNSEKIRTPIGEYQTTILKSERTGSSRVTRYWYAPELGYVPARAERTSKGKVDIVMELKSFQFL